MFRVNVLEVEESGDPEETKSDEELMENDIGEEMMSDMGIRVRNTTFIFPGRVLSQTEKLKKEKLNPGDAESIMYCEGLSSIKVRDKFHWVRIALPQSSRKKRQVRRKSWTHFPRHRKSWTRSPKHWKFTIKDPKVNRMS